LFQLQAFQGQVSIVVARYDSIVAAVSTITAIPA